MKFKVGDVVEKVGGDYKFAGWVVSTFTKRSGAERVVVEDDRGVLHVYSEGNLKHGQVAEHVCGLQGFGAMGDSCPGCTKTTCKSEAGAKPVGEVIADQLLALWADTCMAERPDLDGTCVTVGRLRVLERLLSQRDGEVAQWTAHAARFLEANAKFMQPGAAEIVRGFLQGALEPQ